jgi:hypothetical protein
MKKLPIALFLTFVLLNAGCTKEELNDPDSLSVENGKALTITDISFVVTAVVDAEYFELSKLDDGSRIIKDGACSGTVSGKINTSLSQFRISSIEAVENPNEGLPRELPYIYLVDGEGIIYTRPTDYFRFTMTDGAYWPGNYEAGLVGPDPHMGALFSTNFGNAPRPGSVTITEGYGKFKSLVGKKLKAQNGFDPLQIDRIKGTWKLYFSPLN